MLNKLRHNFFNKRNLQFYYYNFYHKFLCDRKPKNLFDNGYIKLEKKFPLEILNLEKYLSYNNYEFVSIGKNIEIKDLKQIYNILYNEGVISIIKGYLGKNIYCYDNSIKTLGVIKSTDRSWQPHHDSKGRRLKVYIWLSEKNPSTHPLFYLRKTHKNIINWKNYEETRFPNIKPEKFDKIYGEKGSIIIFDTHGIHSHFKKTTVPRSVIELTFEAAGFFNRLNKTNLNKEIERLNLIKLESLI